MRIALPASHYSKPETVANFNDQLLARVQHLPGVRAVSLSTALPMRTINEQSYQLPGIPEDRNKPLVTDWARVTAGHVKAVGMRILRGRDFEPADMLALQPHVALVNEAFAKANWPNQQPLAKQFLFANEQGKEIPYSVVGVVSDEHQFGPDTATHTQIYLPGHHQQSSSLVVRSSGDPLALTNAVKQQVWAIDQDQPVSAVASMDNILYEWTAPRRFTMTVLLNFAGIALLLAAVGLYSVLAYSVSLRTREIGIRMALGAAPAQVVTFVLRQGVVLALLGIGLGLAGAFALTQLMQSILFGISASDPITFIAVSALLLAVGLAASFLPARRALRIEPQLALRAE
jgi:putative ABC transport system permease protein